MAHLDIEVRYAETDQMGVVHHANYLVWFEQARTRLCLETGHHYADIERLGYFLVVTRTECRHLKGAVYGDTVRVSAHLDHMTSRGLRFAYTVERGDVHGDESRDGNVERLADGATEHIWVDRESGRPCRIPKVLKASFERLAG